MMGFRSLLSFFLCLCALTVGILTVRLTARNRARAGVLDEEQRWCEVYSRQNELLRAELQREEWELLSGDDEEEDVRHAVVGPRVED